MLKTQSSNSLMNQPVVPLASITANAVFPGRTVLLPREVAEVLSITDQQVYDLISEGSIAAVNISSGLQTQFHRRGQKPPRRHYRIPVSAYDAFIASRQSV